MVETLDDVDIDDDDDTELKGMKSDYLCNDSKEDTLLMAVILSSLRDGGKLSLMNENNDRVGLIGHDCGFYSSVTLTLFTGALF